MQVPETPNTVAELDLMIRLKEYADGKASWMTKGQNPQPNARAACLTLYTNLLRFADDLIGPLLDRTNAREMETFTLHDRLHARKVAHLMWHILSEDRRQALTPGEIGLLVAAAFYHDVGMALSPAERAARLDPQSDLWNLLELDNEQKRAIEQLRASTADSDLGPTQRERARRALAQAEEVLLCQDTRDRHAIPERYRDTLQELDRIHSKGPEKIPDPNACLSFDGDSFRDKLIDVCTSHNLDAGTLLENDSENTERSRFPRDFPVGCCNADLHMVAAALRLADILDFDRERTPPVLYYYLLPGPLALSDGRSVLEWGKHLSISNWHIEKDAVVFRGRCKDYVLHHAVVTFCHAIQEEFAGTRATFGSDDDTTWPFVLPSSVKADIHSQGYKYIPYRFELDDNRVYQLLMGGAIYDNPLVAVRELVQNAVDACMLRDQLTKLHEPQLTPATEKRIFVRYEEPTDSEPHPRLVVTDTGTGMDEWILARYFLKVGRSYYSSPDFNRTRVALRNKDLDFAPVSEFGIGFLSCFLLGDRVVVQTAMWEPQRKQDTRKRTLQIDGPSRLIRLQESDNAGHGRFKGTRITIHLTRGGENKNKPPTYGDITSYLREVCQELPYRLHLVHVRGDQVLATDAVDPLPLTVVVPRHLEDAVTLVPVDDPQSGLQGEIALVSSEEKSRIEKRLFSEAKFESGDRDDPESSFCDVLVRAGFRIGGVPGLPANCLARLRLPWSNQNDHRYAPPNLARNRPSEAQHLARDVTRIWVSFLLEHVAELEPKQDIMHHTRERLPPSPWLERFDAATVFRLAELGWRAEAFSRKNNAAELEAWKAGTGVPLLQPANYYLHGKLLDLVLPRICQRAFSEETPQNVDNVFAIYVAPPVTDWPSILENWRSFDSAPVRWSPWSLYRGRFKGLLYHGSANALNSRYQTRANGFTTSELHTLWLTLCGVVHAYNQTRRVHLSSNAIQLLHRARTVFKDLKIACYFDTWPIDQIDLPDPD